MLAKTTQSNIFLQRSGVKFKTIKCFLDLLHFLSQLTFQIALQHYNHILSLESAVLSNLVMNSAKIPLLDPTFLVTKIVYNTIEELAEYVNE